MAGARRIAVLAFGFLATTLLCCTSDSFATVLVTWYIRPPTCVTPNYDFQAVSWQISADAPINWTNLWWNQDQYGGVPLLVGCDPVLGLCTLPPPTDGSCCVEDSTCRENPGVTSYLAFADSHCGTSCSSQTYCLAPSTPGKYYFAAYAQTTTILANGQHDHNWTDDVVTVNVCSGTCLNGACCGDGIADPVEQCDSGDRKEQTCISLGFVGGNLTCSPNCTLDITGCWQCQPALTCCDGLGHFQGAGTTCDDGRVCTVGDTCNGNGGCVSGSSRDCSFLSDQCNDGVCSEGSGGCIRQPKGAGTPCDDGQFCTATDTCNGSGNCSATGTRDCSALSDQCNVGTCSAALQQCVKQPLPVVCNDGKICPPEACDPGNPNSCPTGQTCRSDCNACIQTSCLSDCSVLSDACNTGVCNLSTAQCERHPKADGTSCDDGDSCRVNDHCVTGACVGDPHCNDGVVETSCGEQCDGADLNAQTCASLGLGTGTPTCDANCRLDTSPCSGCAPPFDTCLDDFLCYTTKTTAGTRKFASIPGLTLADQFESGAFDVKAPKELCAPADKNGSGTIDSATHLRAYKTKPAKGTPKHVPQMGINISNQFGSISVDTKKVALLLVPTSKDLGSEPPPPTATDVDHYKCYKVRVTKGTPKFLPVRVSLNDQFTSPAKYLDLKGPKLLCNPVDKRGEGIKHGDRHLLCYKVKLTVGEQAHVSRVGLYLANQFGVEQADTKKEDLLCVPSEKILPNATTTTTSSSTSTSSTTTSSTSTTLLVPQIDSITPGSVTLSNGPLDISFSGSNFSTGIIYLFRGPSDPPGPSGLQATPVSSSLVTYHSDRFGPIAGFGPPFERVGTYYLQLFNPVPSFSDGQRSNTVTFTIYQPVPVISQIVGRARADFGCTPAMFEAGLCDVRAQGSGFAWLIGDIAGNPDGAWDINGVEIPRPDLIGTYPVSNEVRLLFGGQLTPTPGTYTVRVCHYVTASGAVCSTAPLIADP